MASREARQQAIEHATEIVGTSPWVTRSGEGGNVEHLPRRHPEPDGWKAHSIRQAAQIRELEAEIERLQEYKRKDQDR